MKLIFEQTPEHIKDLQKQVFFGGVRWKIYIVIAIVLIFINIFNFSFAEVKDTSQDIDTPSFFAEVLSWIFPLAIIILIWYFIFKRAYGVNAIKKNNPSLLGSRELDVSEENIHYKTNEFEGTFNWSALTNFKETELCYFLHIGRAQAIVIPKSAFESEAQKEEFKVLVHKKMQV